MEKITPGALQERGFAYEACGISGCDQWHGIPFWKHEEKGLSFRGFVTTSRGGNLQMMGIPGLLIENLEELDSFLKLIK